MDNVNWYGTHTSSKRELSVLLINFVLFWFIIVHRLYRYVIDFLVCLYSPVVLNLLSPVWVF